MKIRVFSCNEFVFSDASVSEQPLPCPVVLHAARGGRTGCQLLIETETEGAEVEVTVEQCDGVPMPAAELFELRHVMVEKNTGRRGFVATGDEDPSDYVTRLAPFRIYDAMRPLGDGRLPVTVARKRAAFYVSWRIPEGADAGEARCAVRVVGKDSTGEVSVRLVVSPATVPEHGRLRVTNWFSLENMATRHGHEPWSEDHWSMIQAYARLMRRGRQTNVLFPHRIIQSQRNADGTYRFDFSRLVRLTTLFFDLGFSCLEGGHVGTRRRFGDPEFVLTRDPSIKATGPDGYDYLAQFLPAWRQFLVEHGWIDKAIQYVGDEPIDASAEDYRVLAGIVRKFLPGIPLIDAVERPGLGGAVDIWVPKNSYYQDHREAFEHHRRLGDALWFYTCCIPGGKYANRLLDMPLLRTRYLHWGNYRYDLTGYLHWGFNHYKSTQNPFEENAPAHGEGGTTNLPPGDTHIVYPGDDGPWPSVRLETMAMGIEDYELLCQLRKHHPEQAERICKQVFRAFDDMSEDVRLFGKTHKHLLDAVAAIDE